MQMGLAENQCSSYRLTPWKNPKLSILLLFIKAMVLHSKGRRSGGEMALLAYNYQKELGPGDDLAIKACTISLPARSSSDSKPTKVLSGGRRNQDRRIIELNFVDNCTPKDQLSLYRRLFEEYPQIYPAEESRIGLQTTDSHLNQLLGDNFVS